MGFNAVACQQNRNCVVVVISAAQSLDRKRQLELLVPVHHVVACLGGFFCRACHWRAVVSAWASSRVIDPTLGGTGGHVDWAAARPVCVPSLAYVCSMFRIVEVYTYIYM